MRPANDAQRSRRADQVVRRAQRLGDRRRGGAAARRRAINEQSLCCVEQFETAVTAAGGQVHWARDATARPTRIVVELVRAEDADELFKVKSMATQEFGLNEALAER